jgi:hypothetical protein
VHRKSGNGAGFVQGLLRMVRAKGGLRQQGRGPGNAASRVMRPGLLQETENV